MSPKDLIHEQDSSVVQGGVIIDVPTTAGNGDAGCVRLVSWDPRENPRYVGAICLEDFGAGQPYVNKPGGCWKVLTHDQATALAIALLKMVSHRREQEDGAS